jgi:1-acyl-sn-glycerol-3-phosphate acyltransferase
LEVEGHEKIPTTGGVILAPNHVSYLDPPCAGAALERPVWFMAKSELFKIPILGQIIPKTHAFPVRRGTADRAALRKAISLLEEGKVVLIFPEGKRNTPGQPGSAEAGIGLVALKSKAPIVPVALIGTETVLPQHSPFLKFGKIKVRIGDPIPMDDLYNNKEDRDALRKVGDRVMAAIVELMKDEHPKSSTQKVV